MIHEMYGCQCMILKKIKIIFVSLIICSVVGNLNNTSAWRKRIKDVSLIENLRIKSLSCFKHQMNIIIVFFPCAKEVSSTSNLCFEWMEYWFICSILLQNINIRLKVYFKWNPGHETCGSVQIHYILYCW